MGTRRLAIKITTSFDGGGSKKAQQEISGLSKSMGQLGKISAAIGAGGLLLKVGRDAIQTASDIQEMRSKFDTVFGSSADSVTNQLQNFADVANRSIFDLQGFAAGFQDTFVPLGFAREKAADLSVGLVKLTEDLASFNNVAASDVSANLSSALVGNHEAVRSFGIVITETTLKAELAANGWDKLTGSALEQAKVQARLNIIMRSTTDAQGDAVRTADSYANQVKGLEAAWKNFLGTTGNLLLPVATDIVTKMAEGANVIAHDMTPAVAALTGEYGRLADQMAKTKIEEAAGDTEKLVEASNDLAKALDTAETPFGDVTGSADELRRNLMGVMAGFIDTSKAGDTVASQNQVVRESLQAVYGEALTVERGYVKLNGVTVSYAGSLFDLAQKLEAQAAASQAASFDAGMLENSIYNVQRAAGERTLSEFTDEMRKASIEAGQAAGWESEMAEAMGEANLMTANQTAAFIANQIALQQNNIQTERAIAANAALVGAFRETEAPIQAFLDAQQLAIDSQGTWVQTTRDNSRQLSEISQKLAADLDDDQRKAYQEILNTTAEGSAEWLAAWKALQADLTASQRAELIAQSADLQAAQGEMGSAYTGSIADMRAAKDAAIAANAEMVASYQNLALEGSLALAELSPDPEAIQRTLDYAVAIGAMTQQEANLRLEAANTRLAIEELNQKVVEGDITAEEAAIAFEQLVSGHKRVSTTSRNLRGDTELVGKAFTGILGPIDEVIGRLNSLDGRTVRTRVEVNTVDSGGSVGGGKTEGKAFGGAVFPGRSYLVGERGPELLRLSSPGTIVPNNQMMGSGLNGNVTIQVYQQPGESGEMLANRISRILSKRARQIRTAGG